MSGSHFLAGARLSPDGQRLAWIAWEHPQMPWDGTELRVADLGADGTCGPHRTLLGSTTESVLQPEWIDDDQLWALGDVSGYWNVYRIGLDGLNAEVGRCGRPPTSAARCGSSASRWYRPLADGRLLVVRTFGTDTLAYLDPASGEYEDIDLGDVTSVGLGPVDGDRVLLSSGGAQTPSGVRLLDLATRSLTDVRLALDDIPDCRLPAGRRADDVSRRGWT